jgi:hypothetical protein
MAASATPRGGDYLGRRLLQMLLYADDMASCTKVHHVLDNPLQKVHTGFLRGLGQLRKSMSTTVLHKEMCMDPVAKGWLRSSLALWDRLQEAPADSLLGTAIRESIHCSLAGNRGGVSWAGNYMAMLDKLMAGGSRDSEGAVQNMG